MPHVLIDVEERKKDMIKFMSEINVLMEKYHITEYEWLWMLEEMKMDLLLGSGNNG